LNNFWKKRNSWLTHASANLDFILNKINLLASLNLLERVCLQDEGHPSAYGANALAATGMDDTAAENGSSWDAEPFTEAARIYEQDENIQDSEDDLNVLTVNDLRGNKRDVARRGQVRLSGLEPETYGLKVTCEPQETLEKQGFLDDAGADAGAVETKTAHFEPDLQAVIDGWQDLPEAIKTGILAMVRAGSGAAAGGGR
jgi:hypothetical protein